MLQNLFMLQCCHGNLLQYSTEVEVNSGGYLPSQRGKREAIFKREAILFFFGCSEVNRTWLITSELANQRARTDTIH